MAEYITLKEAKKRREDRERLAAAGNVTAIKEEARKYDRKIIRGSVLAILASLASNLLPLLMCKEARTISNCRVLEEIGGPSYPIAECTYTGLLSLLFTPIIIAIFIIFIFVLRGLFRQKQLTKKCNRLHGTLKTALYLAIASCIFFLAFSVASVCYFYITLTA